MSDYTDELDYYYGEDDEDNAEKLPLKFRRIAHETKQAYLIEFKLKKNLEPVQAWLPKSQCDMGSEVVWVPRWLIEEKDLWQYEKTV